MKLEITANNSLKQKRLPMNRGICLLTFLSLISVSHESLSQDKEKILAEGDTKNIFDKKLTWGISLNQYWGTIKGSNLPSAYFTKPCIGFNIRAEYYFLSFLGVSAGAGIQQRGAGIINPDVSGGAFSHPWAYPQNNGDSTYRERLRFNTIEVPLTLLLRTPKDVFKGVRLSGAAGIVYSHISWTKDVFLSVEDGYHTITNVSSDYIPNDAGYQLSVGPDINAGGGCLLQIHFVYAKGTKNVYQSGPGDGRLKTMGFRVTWLF